MSFYEQATTPECRRGLAYLSRQAFVADFYLAGGTALALQLGHRISTDLDWFSTTRHLDASERDGIRQALSGSGASEVVSEQDGMLFTRLFGTDASFLYQQHPPLFFPAPCQNWHLLTLLQENMLIFPLSHHEVHP